MKLPEVGTLFQSKYRLDSVLGSGGFAVVFKATDVGADRTVAIKVLTPDDRGYSATVQSRFEREVRVVANLRDPHTIKLFDFGTSTTGLLFMVTEYVPGEDLSGLLDRRGRLEPHEVVHIMWQVLSSLREAHTAGLLHRDIKPANIRIYDYMGDPLRVKVLDFGIAKPLQDDAAAITAAGELVGTLRYMSPEQLLSSELSASSDIYSLGLVAFEMLLGSTGIHGNRLSDQMDRLVTGHIFSIPELERIGPELSRVLDKMAARDRNMRYQVVDEVLGALRHLPGADVAPTTGPGWSGPLQSQRRSDELLPPSAVPHTGPGFVHPPSGVTPTTGSREIPRPVPVTDPAIRLPEVAARNRTILAIAGALIGAVAVLVGIVLYMSEEKVEAPVTVGTRTFSHLKGSQPPPQPAAPAPAVIVDAGSLGDDVRVERARDAGTPRTSAGCGNVPSFVGNGELSVRTEFESHTWQAFLPSDYDPGRAYPLLVMLHENAENPHGFITYSGFATLAEDVGIVILAPDGGFPMAWTKVDGVATVASVVSDAFASLCIDPQQVFALGHAAGGKVAEALPCEVPEIKAIATTSYRGEPGGTAALCNPYKPVPYIHVAPLQDGYNPVAGGASCSGATKISLAKKEALWRANHHCGERVSTWHKAGKDKCLQWDCETDFVSCHLVGGRRWPGQTARFADLLTGNNCDGTSTKFDYTATIWKFFQEHAPH